MDIPRSTRNLQALRTVVSRLLRPKPKPACAFRGVPVPYILGAPISAKSLAEGIDDLQSFELKVTNIARHNRHAVRERSRGEH